MLLFVIRFIKNNSSYCSVSRRTLPHHCLRDPAVMITKSTDKTNDRRGRHRCQLVYHLGSTIPLPILARRTPAVRGEFHRLDLSGPRSRWWATTPSDFVAKRISHRLKLTFENNSERVSAGSCRNASSHLTLRQSLQATRKFLGKLLA